MNTKKRKKSERYAWRIKVKYIKKLCMLFIFYSILHTSNTLSMQVPKKHCSPEDKYVLDEYRENISISTKKNMLFWIKKPNKTANVLNWMLTPSETIAGIAFDTFHILFCKKTETNLRRNHFLLNQQFDKKLVDWAITRNAIALQFEGGEFKLFTIQKKDDTYHTSEIFTYTFDQKIINFCFSENKKLVAITLEDNTTHIFENNRRLPSFLTRHTSRPKRLIIRNDKTILIHYENNYQIIYDIQSQKPIYMTPPHKKAEDYTPILAWDIKENYLLLYYSHNVIRIVDINEKASLISCRLRNLFCAWGISKGKQYVTFLTKERATVIHIPTQTNISSQIQKAKLSPNKQSIQITINNKTVSFDIGNTIIKKQHERTQQLAATKQAQIRQEKAIQMRHIMQAYRENKGMQNHKPQITPPTPKLQSKQPQQTIEEKEVYKKTIQPAYENPFTVTVTIDNQGYPTITFFRRNGLKKLFRKKYEETYITCYSTKSNCYLITQKANTKMLTMWDFYGNEIFKKISATIEHAVMNGSSILTQHKKPNGIKEIRVFNGIKLANPIRYINTMEIFRTTITGSVSEFSVRSSIDNTTHYTTLYFQDNTKKIYNVKTKKELWGTFLSKKCNNTVKGTWDKEGNLFIHGDNQTQKSSKHNITNLPIHHCDMTDNNKFFYLITHKPKQELHIWDIQKRKAFCTLECPNGTSPQKVWVDHSQNFVTIYLIDTNDNRTCHVYNTKTKQIVFSQKNLPYKIYFSCIKDNYIAFQYKINKINKIKIFDIHQKKEIFNMEERESIYNNTIKTFILAANKKYICIHIGDNVSIYSIKTKKQLCKRKMITSPCLFAVSTDEKFFRLDFENNFKIYNKSNSLFHYKKEKKIINWLVKGKHLLVHFANHKGIILKRKPRVYSEVLFNTTITDDIINWHIDETSIIFILKNKPPRIFSRSTGKEIAPPNYNRTTTKLPTIVSTKNQGVKELIQKEKTNVAKRKGLFESNIKQQKTKTVFTGNRTGKKRKRSQDADTIPDESVKKKKKRKLTI